MKVMTPVILRISTQYNLVGINGIQNKKEQKLMKLKMRKV